MNEQTKIAAGINYLRTMRQSSMNVYELAEDLEISVAHIKACIEAAQRQKVEMKKEFELAIKRPKIFIGKAPTGDRQIIKKVEIELDKTLNVNYDTRKQSSFVVMIPARVTITRM